MDCGAYLGTEVFDALPLVWSIVLGTQAADTPKGADFPSLLTRKFYLKQL